MSQQKPLRPKGPAWRAAEEFGCDMSLVEENLKLTPQERIRRHDRALRTITMLKEARRRGRADA